MAHLSGAILVDCPASALNNAGADTGSRTDNAVAVKKIKTKAGTFPYVSAQAFRFWLRDTLTGVEGWTPSPIFREAKVAYTDANPIEYAEDDIFGYMRAPSTKAEAVKARDEQELLKKATPIESGVTLTRSSVLKVSTLISLSPSDPEADFGVMARHEGNPVPFEHEFYRTTLVGLFSVDLRMLGRFYHVDRTGYKHLDSVRKKLAEENGLSPYDNGRAYQLRFDRRKERLNQLLQGLARITGGAKLALHYTDVSPRLLLMGVAKGGNHLFGTAVGADKNGLPKINTEAIKEVARVHRDDLLSGFYVGLMQGYLDDQRTVLQTTLDDLATQDSGRQFTLSHPVEAVRAVIEDLDKNAEAWLA
jgi:CRISPR-associated protein Cst2